MKKTLDVDNQNVQDAIRKFQDTKNKEANKGTQRGLEQKPQ
jgi:hypothetical protein